TSADARIAATGFFSSCDTSATKFSRAWRSSSSRRIDSSAWVSARTSRPRGSGSGACRSPAATRSAARVSRSMGPATAPPIRIARSGRGQLGDGACLVFGGAGGEERSARCEPVDDEPGEHGGEQQRGRGERDEYLKPQRQTRAPRLEQAHDGGAQAEEEEQREREEELLPTHL